MDAGIPDPLRGGIPAGNGSREKNLNKRRRYAGRWKHIFAALDLGTNNCRLLIARPFGRGFRVVDGFSRIVRLGEGLTANGHLSSAAMDRTIDALAICARKMKAQGVTRGHMVATEACRLASNGKKFLERVTAETGIQLDIISSESEAKLAVAGCTTLIDHRCDRVLVFDIGGGSTELIWLDVNCRKHRRQPKILAWTSLPCGVMNLAERFSGKISSPDMYQDMVAYVMTRAEGFAERCDRPNPPRKPEVKSNAMHLLGTSGTVTTLAGIHLGLKRYERRRVDGIWMNTSDAGEIVSRITALEHAQRVEQPCIGTERADLVIPGCAIFDAIMRLWPTDRLRIADRGLREGMLHALMTKADQERGWKGRRHGSKANYIPSAGRP